MTEPDLPVIQYWDTGKPPEDVAKMLATFGAHNPDRRHMVFDERAAAVFIERTFTARESAAFASCAVPAMQADYFRYCAVLAFGGVYSDADFLCVAPLRGLLERTRGGTLFITPSGGVVNGLLVFAAAGHPLPELVLEVITANIEQRISRRVWVATGPAVLTGLYAMARAASIDEFLRMGREHDGGRLELLIGSIAEVAGSRDRVAKAFEDVDVRPFADAFAYIALPAVRPVYKETSVHYLNFGSEIYR